MSNNVKKQLLLSLLLSLGVLFSGHAQVDTVIGKERTPGDMFALPPFRAHVITILGLPDHLGGNNLKGYVNGMCITDSLGKILDIQMQAIVLIDKRSNDTVMLHEFSGDPIGRHNKARLPNKVQPYFKWWYKQAPGITDVREVNREAKPGMVLSPPIRDTNYVRAIYQIR